MKPNLSPHTGSQRLDELDIRLRFGSESDLLSHS